MAAPREIVWTVWRGASLDETIAVPTDGGSPLTDGSWVEAAFRQARDDAEAVLGFDTRDPLRALTIEGYDPGTATMTLSFRAARAAILAVPAGAYTAVAIHGRERPGPFGPKCDAVAIITLNVL